MCEIGTFLGIGKVTKLEITKFEIGGDKVQNYFQTKFTKTSFWAIILGNYCIKMGHLGFSKKIFENYYYR